MTNPHGGPAKIWRDQKGEDGVLEQPMTGDSPAQATDPWQPPKSQIRDMMIHQDSRIATAESGLAQLQTLNASGAAMYADTAAALAATSDGDFFNVPSSNANGAIDLYLNSGGAAVLQRTYPSAGYVDGIADDLAIVRQAIGRPDGELVAGNSGTAGGTYTLANPIAFSGNTLKYTCYANAANTITLRVFSRSGDDFTVVRSYAFPVVIGVNTITLTDFPFEAGQYIGFTVFAGCLAITSGIDATTGGYYSASGQIINDGETYTDASVSDAIFLQRFDFIERNATGQNVKVLRDDVDGLQSAVGLLTQSNQVVGRPEGSVLEFNLSAGSSYYVFESEADTDRILKSFRIWGSGPGVMEVSAWSTAEDGTSQLERSKFLNILNSAVSGVNEFDNLGLIVKKGEKLAIRRGTGYISFTSDGVNPTPYRSIGTTSGVLGGLTTTNRFEFTAVLEPHNLETRVSDLEDGTQSVDLLDTHTFHAIWMLGESHIASRGLTLSDAVIPNGGGYVYRRATGTMEQLQDPTGNDSTAIAGSGRGSMGPAAGRMLLDITKGAIGAAIVNSGLGSTTIGNHWASGDSAWTQAVADWADAKAQMDTLNKSLCGLSVLIGIGSNDAAAATPKATFKAGLIDLISRVRTEIGYDVPILLLPTGPFADNTYATEVAYIQDAQHEIAKEVAGVRLVTTATEYAADNGWFLDNVHFTQTANEAIGAALGAAAFAVGTGNVV